MNVDQVDDLAADYVGHTLVGCHLRENAICIVTRPLRLIHILPRRGVDLGTTVSVQPVFKASYPRRPLVFGHIQQKLRASWT